MSTSKYPGAVGRPGIVCMSAASAYLLLVSVKIAQ